MRHHLSLLVLVRALLLFPLLSLQADAEVTVKLVTPMRDDVVTAVNLCVESSPPVEEEITVDYVIRNGTAVEGEDFMLEVSATGTITVPANGTSACLNGAVTYVDDDDLYETDQYYEFEISGPNVTGGVSSTEYVIEDSTPVPNITFVMPTYTFPESDDVTPEVQVTTGGVFVQSPAVVTASLTVELGSAEANDFTLLGPVVVNFHGSNVTGFEIAIHSDGVYEGTEDFFIRIPSDIVTIIIQDSELPPMVVIKAPEAILKPDRIVDLCAVISIVSEPEIVVGYSVIGNEAELGKDFTVLNGSDGDIVIEPGTLEGCIVLEILDDMVFEANETITFSLTNSSHGTLGDPSSVIIPIIDNESPPRLNVISPSEVDVNENSTGGVVICVSVSHLSAFAISVSYQVTDDNTTATEDYNVMGGVSGTLNFQPLQEQDCVTINVVDDDVYEGNERLMFQLSNPENATLDGPSEVTITIIDNDDPVLSVQPLLGPVEESVGNISVCINASVPSIFVNRVSFSVIGGNATLHEDYMYVGFPNATGDLTLMPFETSDCVTISIEDDNVYEGTEQFTFMLSDATKASVSNQNSSITITIIDDESFPVLTLSAPSEVDESAGNFTICVNSSVRSSFIISVMCIINDIGTTFGEDYTVPMTNTDRVQFEPLGMSECLTVAVVDDMEYEGDEVVSVELIDPTNADLGNPSAVNITIVDNDPSPVPSPSSSASPATTESTAEDDTLLYIIVGAVGGAVLAALVFLLLIILIIACCRMKVNRQGFYVTDEDKGDAPQMLRYSASLRSISSQTVVPVDTRDKENEYMV